MRTLDDVRSDAMKCEACELCRNRINTVFGSGYPDARIIIISDYPGREETKAGIPMIGAAGRFNDECLKHAGADRKEFFITNAVFCPPAGDQEISKKSMQECKKFLNDIINVIDPLFVITMGGVAAETMLGRRVAVTKEIGSIYSVRVKGNLIDYEIPVGILMNPAYLMRENDLSESGPTHKQIWFLHRFIVMADELANKRYKTPIPKRHSSVGMPSAYQQVDATAKVNGVA